MHILLYIIRHGETALNAQGRIQGQIDVPLNRNGIDITIQTGKALRKMTFDRVISSPLPRAYHTAQLIIEQNDAGMIPSIETNDRLMEIDWGSWEGLCCLPDNYEIPSEHFDDFFHNPFAFDGSPDGESIQDVCDRTEAFLRDLTSDPENDGKVILISTHGCAMRALLQQVYEDKSDFWHGRVPENCAVNVVSYANGKYTLLEEDAIYYDKRLSHNPYMEQMEPNQMEEETGSHDGTGKA